MGKLIPEVIVTGFCFQKEGMKNQHMQFSQFQKKRYLKSYLRKCTDIVLKVTLVRIINSYE